MGWKERREETEQRLANQEERIMAQEKIARERVEASAIRGEEVTGIDALERKKLGREQQEWKKWGRRKAKWDARRKS